MSARAHVADLWDGVIADWTPGQATWPGALQAWFDSYPGKGAGAVDLGQYPDPWVGDLRGIRAEPRLVVLGLNPGVGYDALQGAGGTWTERIRAEGYSRCLERSPAEDPSIWRAVHGRQSPYWVRLEKFAQRWLEDPAADHRDVLNFELYPWHFPILTAGITSPPDTARELVLDPIAEVEVADVFAFGAPWFTVGQELDLPLLATWGRAATRGRRRTAGGPSRCAASRPVSGWWSPASRGSAARPEPLGSSSSATACRRFATPEEPPTRRRAAS